MAAKDKRFHFPQLHSLSHISIHSSFFHSLAFYICWCLTRCEIAFLSTENTSTLPLLSNTNKKSLRKENVFQDECIYIYIERELKSDWLLSMLLQFSYHYYFLNSKERRKEDLCKIGIHTYRGITSNEQALRRLHSHARLYSIEWLSLIVCMCNLLRLVKLHIKNWSVSLSPFYNLRRKIPKSFYLKQYLC